MYCLLYRNRKCLDCAKQRVDILQWGYTAASSINGRASSVLSRPVNSQGERHVFPSDWTCTSWVGVNFTGPQTKVVDHVEIAFLPWRFHHYHCFILGRIAPRPPWVLPDSAHCVETVCSPPETAAPSLAGQGLLPGRALFKH